MTVTMGQIVEGALKRLRLINARKTPDAITAASGLEALNDMMHAWKGQGVDTDHDTLSATDDFPLDDEHIQGTKALLAVRLASDHGMQISDSIVIDAKNGWSALQAEFVEPAPAAQFDQALLRIGRC